jgi:uncharacterized protein with von Willebrand factor type A (vWA) domain
MSPTDDADLEPADVPDARDDVLAAVVGFARDLRAAGAAVPATAAIDATAALAELGWAEKATARAATRATLLTRESDRETFDRLFDDFWSELRAAGRDPPEVLEDLADAADPPSASLPDESDQRELTSDPDDADTQRGNDRDDARSAGASSLATTSDSDFFEGKSVERASYSPVGGSEAVSRTAAVDRYGLAEPVDRLTGALATLPGRRRRSTPTGRFVDARRALRSSFETGGVVATVPEAEPTDSAVRGVVLVDVSQSVLDSVDRSFLLEWLRLLVDRWRSTRVFFFDTDVREVTEAFDERTVGDVGDALARAEATWGGGTRIGRALATVRDSYPDAVDHRTVVFVVSDGLERGDVDDLAESAAWLGRRAGLV